VSRRRQPQDPTNAAEWQEAVDHAHFFLLLDSARQFGLITGGPAIDVERCEEILEKGAALGYTPKELKK
jgi:hypothetical protein